MSVDWPTAAEFAAVLQNPRIAFRDRELQQVTIERDPLHPNQVFLRSGRYACVCRATRRRGSDLAIRCFTSAEEERQERYGIIHEYIKRYVARCPLKSLVGFEYRDGHIRSPRNGKWYPLMTMDWVRGDTLYHWIGGRCRERDRPLLGKAAELWIELVAELRAARIAHGDLQHDNVLVTRNGTLELKLVDYDGMCVPGLEGRRNLEIGVDPYQHPKRDKNTRLGPNLDNFSALFILVAMKALAVEPRLWDAYVEKVEYDKLLFRREDLDRPQQSPLMQALRRSADHEVQRLCAELVELTHVELDQVPRLDEVLFSFRTVESVLDQRDFDKALELLRIGRKRIADAEPPLRARLQEADQRVKLRLALQKAVDDGDEDAMARLAAAPLLRNYPAAEKALGVASSAPQVKTLTRELDDAMRRQAWDEFLALWQKNENLLQDRKSTRRFLGEVKTWQARVGAYAAVLRLLSQPPCPASDLTAAWQRLVATKHPGCASLKPKVEDTLKRSNAWDAFQAVELADSETCDRALVKAWNEALFADWGPAETRRPRVELARERLALVDKLSERADAALSLEGEKALVQIALEIKTAHGAYAYELKPRARQAQERLRAVQELREGLRRPASDRKIHRAWRSLVALEGQSLAPEAWRPLVEKAEKRAPLLARLEAVPPGYVPAEAPQFDAVVLEVFEQNEALLEGCHDAEGYRGDYRQARQRRELLAELGAAMARPDHARIVRLVGEPCLEGYPFPEEWQKTIQQAREEHLACLSLVEALEGDDRARFHAVFDAAIIGRNRSAFEAHRAKLREWVPAEILPLCKIGLGPPVGDPPLAPVEEAAHPVFRACWRWPDLRMNDSCVLAVCRQRPQADANPYLLPSVLFTRQVDRRAYEDGFGAVQLGFREEWDGAYVGVWAVVDLGFESFFSECLVLGQLGKLREPGEARWGVTTLFDSLWS